MSPARPSKGPLPKPLRRKKQRKPKTKGWSPPPKQQGDTKGIDGVLLQEGVGLWDGTIIHPDPWRRISGFVHLCLFLWDSTWIRLSFRFSLTRVPKRDTPICRPTKEHHWSIFLAGAPFGKWRARGLICLPSTSQGGHFGHGRAKLAVNPKC